MIVVPSEPTGHDESAKRKRTGGSHGPSASGERAAQAENGQQHPTQDRGTPLGTTTLDPGCTPSSPPKAATVAPLVRPAQDNYAAQAAQAKAAAAPLLVAVAPVPVVLAPLLAPLVRLARDNYVAEARSDSSYNTVVFNEHNKHEPLSNLMLMVLPHLAQEAFRQKRSGRSAICTRWQALNLASPSETCEGWCALPEKQWATCSLGRQRAAFCGCLLHSRVWCAREQRLETGFRVCCRGEWSQNVLNA